MFGLASLVFGALAWWSFTSATHPSPITGALSVVATIASLVGQLHVASYRVEAGPDGLAEKTLGGTKRFAWEDVQRVECIAQSSATDRWAAPPEEAFHVVVHTRAGRVAVHRWMLGVDDYVQVLDVHGAFARRDARVEPLTSPRRSHRVLAAAQAGMDVGGAIVAVSLLSWIAGLVAVIGMHARISDNVALDATLVGALPWSASFVVYRAVSAVRARRFGQEYARPPIGLRDGVMTLGAAIAGPLLFIGFGQRAIASHASDWVDLVFLAVGGWFVWIPIGAVRKLVRER
jgi:hypothetical protein